MRVDAAGAMTTSLPSSSSSTAGAAGATGAVTSSTSALSATSSSSLPQQPGTCSVSFTWKITNFKLKIDKDKFKDDNPSLVSQRFGLPGWMWELRLHPRGDGPDNSGHISIYLAAVRSEREIAIDRNDLRGDRSAGHQPTWTRAVKYTISIPRTRTPEGGDAGNVYSGESSNVFESQCALSWGWKKYLDRSRLEEALQPDGSLLLNVKVMGECPPGMCLVDFEPLKVSMLDERDAQEAQHLFLSPSLADIEFVIRDESSDGKGAVRIPSHRQILALRSEYWRVMFTSGLRESAHSVLRSCPTGQPSSSKASSQKPNSSETALDHAETPSTPSTSPHITTIEIVDVPAQGFKAMLEYLYTSRVVTYFPKSREEKYDLLMIADRYQLPGLHNLIGYDLAKEILRTSSRINCADVLELLSAASTYGGGECTALRDVCLNFAKSRLADLRSDADAFKSWCKEADRDLLAELWTAQLL
ncbi:hypothetical protein DFJ73DRAFT_835972 [Zopfochytrium polystomum]|nr:hypothetical protein DFJ73DRAFT_835972 [Zopfochytrium polystomum]